MMEIKEAKEILNNHGFVLEDYSFLQKSSATNDRKKKEIEY